MIILELTLNLYRLGYMKNLYRDTWSYFMTRDNDSSMTFAVIFWTEIELATVTE